MSSEVLLYKLLFYYFIYSLFYLMNTSQAPTMFQVRLSVVDRNLKQQSL